MAGCLLQAIFIKDFSLKSGNTFLGKTLAQVWIMFGIFATAIAIVFALAGNYDSSIFMAAASVLNLIVPGMAMNRKADLPKCCK